MVTMSKSSSKRKGATSLGPSEFRISKKTKIGPSNKPDDKILQTSEETGGNDSKSKTGKDSSETPNIIDHQSSAMVPVSTVELSSSDDESSDDPGPESAFTDDKIVSEKHTKLPQKGKCGVVYLGRIPHGFYEEQMRSYFSQFGTISRLRLCRNKVTGQSKHYAFIEFASSEVADIVAETMNNYLLYDHVLKCRVLPESECNEKMWIGANRKWKTPPLIKIRRIKHERKKSLQVWEVLRKKEENRRSSNTKKWKAAGIDYSFEPPSILEGS